MFIYKRNEQKINKALNEPCYFEVFTYYCRNHFNERPTDEYLNPAATMDIIS